jgi:hypothetical protein
MRVADEMQEELQRDQPLLGIGRGVVGQFGRELVDLVDDAGRRRPLDAGAPGGNGG